MRADARIWDTRKTIPGLRQPGQGGSACGRWPQPPGQPVGLDAHQGQPPRWHRHHRGGGHGPRPVAGRTVHVECDTVEQCTEALDAGADALLLDNMTTERSAAASRRPAARRAGRASANPAGGVRRDHPGHRRGSYAATGVDQISVGAITNSAPVLDIGLDLDIRRRPPGSVPFRRARRPVGRRSAYANGVACASAGSRVPCWGRQSRNPAHQHQGAPCCSSSTSATPRRSSASTTPVTAATNCWTTGACPPTPNAPATSWP